MHRVVIVHEELGIFVGKSMGFAFWSNLDTGGQWCCATFDDEADAREFVKTWEPKQDPDAYRYVTVKDCDGQWATISALGRAGLSSMTRLLLLSAPIGGSA